MGKRQWTPWTGLEEFREHMDRIIDAARQRSAGPESAGFVWVPLADVTETAQAMTARIELPGIALDQVVVEVAEGALVVRGERPPEREEPDTAFHLMERAHGPFARRFPLPEDADGERIRAVLREGVLTVTVPKRGQVSSPRRTVELS